MKLTFEQIHKKGFVALPDYYQLAVSNDDPTSYLATVVNSYVDLSTCVLKFDRLFDYRQPVFRPQIDEDGDAVILTWHQDGYSHDDFPKNDRSVRDFILGLWSNVTPTEIKSPNGREISGQPGQIVLISNERYKHRYPQMTEAELANRYFLRFRLHERPTNV